jgi:hypothetical protein
MAELWMSRTGMGSDDGHDETRYKRMWKIRVMTSLVGFGINHTGVCGVYTENVLMCSTGNIVLGHRRSSGITQTI